MVTKRRDTIVALNRAARKRALYAAAMQRVMLRVGDRCYLSPNAQDELKELLCRRTDYTAWRELNAITGVDSEAVAWPDYDRDKIWEPERLADPKFVRQARRFNLRRFVFRGRMRPPSPYRSLVLHLVTIIEGGTGEVFTWTTSLPERRKNARFEVPARPCGDKFILLMLAINIQLFGSKPPTRETVIAWVKDSRKT